VRNHFGKAFPFSFRKIDFHVRCMLSKEVEYFLAWSAYYFMYLVYLI
jgi:hypothetical protein